MWVALIFGLLFSVQAMVGKGTFDVWKLLFGGDFFTGNGYLLGAGFTQGPGQTQAYASIWETTYKISNSLNVGLAFAAVGFLVAALWACRWPSTASRRAGFPSKAESFPNASCAASWTRATTPPAPAPRPTRQH